MASPWAHTLHELRKLDEAYMTKRYSIIAQGVARLKKEAADGLQRQLRQERAAVNTNSKQVHNSTTPNRSQRPTTTISASTARVSSSSFDALSIDLSSLRGRSPSPSVASIRFDPTSVSVMTVKAPSKAVLVASPRSGSSSSRLHSARGVSVPFESSSARWKTSTWRESDEPDRPRTENETVSRVMPVEVAPFISGMLSIHQGVLLMSWKQRYCVLRQGVLYASAQGEAGPFEPLVQFGSDPPDGVQSKVVAAVVDVSTRSMATQQGFEFSVLSDVSYSAECKLLPHVEAGETVALRFAAPTYRESVAWAKAINALPKT